MTRPVLLVGHGIWGRKIGAELAALGAPFLAWDADPRARALPLPGAGSHAETLEAGAAQAGAAIVATPASTHAVVVATLADHLPPTAPILCEKPLATSVADARAMIRAMGARLFLDHTWRYHPGVVALGELVRSGRLGEVQGIRTIRSNWTSPRTDVDAVWNLVPHDLTLAIELLGAIPDPHAAHAEVIDGRAVGLWAFLGHRPWLVLESSNRSPNKQREIRAHGSLGVAVLRDVTSNAIEFTPNSSTAEPGPPIGIPLPTGNPLRDVLRDFLGHAHGEAVRPKSDGAEGLRVIETIVRLRELAGLPTDA